ncbi:MAG: ABC transporter permease subunit [Trueperaceae bacterium]|nr:ABC transporter permease subunit [Trueperaceae bacterium]
MVPTFFGNPFYTFLLRQFLMQIPSEICEAARIDGANELRIMWHVCLQFQSSTHDSQCDLLMATSTLVELPHLAIFFLQRFFISGITPGSVK